MDEGNEPILVFDDSSKEKILNALRLKETENNEILNEEGKILTNQDFESIPAEEFGGILKGE